MRRLLSINPWLYLLLFVLLPMLYCWLERDNRPVGSAKPVTPNEGHA